MAYLLFSFILLLLYVGSGVWRIPAASVQTEIAVDRDEERFLREYGNAESSSALPWNRNQTDEYVELAEHAPYCDCPNCRAYEPDGDEERNTALAQARAESEVVLVQIDELVQMHIARELAEAARNPRPFDPFPIFPQGDTLPHIEDDLRL